MTLLLWYFFYIFNTWWRKEEILIAFDVIWDVDRYQISVLRLYIDKEVKTTYSQSHWHITVTCFYTFSHIFSHCHAFENWEQHIHIHFDTSFIHIVTCFNTFSHILFTLSHIFSHYYSFFHIVMDFFSHFRIYMLRTQYFPIK